LGGEVKYLVGPAVKKEKNKFYAFRRRRFLKQMKLQKVSGGEKKGVLSPSRKPVEKENERQHRLLGIRKQ